jgi:hypothetical protein
LTLIDTSLWVPYLRRSVDPELVRRVRVWLTAGEAATAERWCENRVGR